MKRISLQNPIKSISLSHFIIAVLIVSMIPYLIYALNFSGFGISQRTSEWADFGSFIGGTITPILSFVTFGVLIFTYHNQRKELSILQKSNETLLHKHKALKKRQEAEIYYDHAVKCLERAYSTISDNGKSSIPIQDRLKWLTCARLILTAEKFSEKIPFEEAATKEKYDDEEDHWRNLFYELFDPHDLKAFSMNSEYFSNIKGGYPTETINEKSIKVIYKFIEWPEGRTDPIQKIERFAKSEIKNFRFGMEGIGRYLNNMKIPRK